MIDTSNIKYCKRLFIQSQSADPVPPLGTILGNLGVNTNTFCTNFNAYTKELPVYFVLKVIIYIYENKSIAFNVNLPSTGFLLNLLKFERTILVKSYDRVNEKIILCVNIYCLLKLALLKFPELPLNKSILILVGSVKSMNIIIV